MNLPLLIARRYFFSKRQGKSFNLINLISGISLLGYIVGAMALVIVLSVFNGFEGMFSAMYNNFDPDMQIIAKEGKTFTRDSTTIANLKKLNGVELVAEVLEENVLLKYDDRQTIAKAKGVDKNYTRLTSLDSCLVAGTMLLEYDDQAYALVGQEIAWKLAVDPSDIFKKMTIYVPSQGAVDVLNPEANFNKALVAPAGIFSVQQEVDETYIIVPIRFLQQLLGREQQLSSLDIKLNEGVSTDHAKSEMALMMGNEFVIKNRYEQREAFYKIMKSEKLISYIILLFILLIAAANSIASLYLLTLEKKKDIGLLANIGMKAKQVYAIFMFEGIFIALTGGTIGIVLGIIICYAQQQFGFIHLTDGSAFMFQQYPVELRLADIVLVFATVVTLGIITAQYPARKAAILNKM
jgi:lipoprotein-releasing system permease protein